MLSCIFSVAEWSLTLVPCLALANSKVSRVLVCSTLWVNPRNEAIFVERYALIFEAFTVLELVTAITTIAITVFVVRTVGREESIDITIDRSEKVEGVATITACYGGIVQMISGLAVLIETMVVNLSIRLLCDALAEGKWIENISFRARSITIVRQKA